MTCVKKYRLIFLDTSHMSDVLASKYMLYESYLTQVIGYERKKKENRVEFLSDLFDNPLTMK